MDTAAESWFEAVDVEFENCNLCNAISYWDIFTSSGPWRINAHLSAHDCQTMYTETLRMLNNFIIGIHTGVNTPQPVNFTGLPADEMALTGLTDDKKDCYIVLFNSAVKMRQQSPFYWANRSFQKAKKVGLASWDYMGLSIKSDTWKTMLDGLGLPTLYETSLCVLKCTF